MISLKDVIVVDIGNSSTHFGCFEGGKCRKTVRTETASLEKNGISAIRRLPAAGAEAVVIASVVPAAGRKLAALTKKAGFKTYQVGRDLKPPVKNRYKKPSQVGIDRLMNAVAFYQQFKREGIVLDFGTAITFDIISKKGEYLGGVIAPGVEISIQALYDKTALLPKITLTHPARIIGKETTESIRIGCSYGIGGLCDRIVSEITARHSMKPLVVATGGHAKFMTKYCRSIQKIDPLLNLKGIYLTYLKSHH